MHRLNKKKFSYYSIIVSLLIFSLFDMTISASKSKDEFYEEIKTFCYPKNLFDNIFEIYNAKDGFYWTDFFFKKDYSKNNFYFEKGSTFLLENISLRAANMNYSSNQALEFYQTYFEEQRYTKGKNTKKTIINNPESRDYLPYMGGCQYEEVGIGYNQFHVPSEPLLPLTKEILSNSDEEKHVEVLFNIMYQLGRGLLYLFQNGFYSEKISVDLIKYSENRGFTNFKLDNALDIR